MTLKNIFPADRIMATVNKITDLTAILKSKNMLSGRIGGYTVVISSKLGIQNDSYVLHVLPDAIIDNLLNRILESKNITEDDKLFINKLMNKPVKQYKQFDIMNYGMVFSLEYLAQHGVILEPKEQFDMSITNLLSIQKWVSDKEIKLYDSKVSKFPSHVPKTDEPRIQGIMELIDKIKMEDECVITEKADGSSCTIIHNNGDFQICSRNFVVADSPNNKWYYDVFKKYNLREKLTDLKINIAIQGEIVGIKINHNRYQLKTIEMYVFNIYDIDKKQYYHYDDMKTLCNKLELPMVKLLYRGKYNYSTLDDLLKYVEALKYDSGYPAEGIVVRSLTKSISFKLINPNYK